MTTISPSVDTECSFDSIDAVKAMGTLMQLWRYPVKSMRGEPVREATLGMEGIAGDRRFAFTSRAAPAGKPLLSGAERAAMLRYAPRLGDQAEVTSPEGEQFALESAELLAALQAGSAVPNAQLALHASPNRPLTDVRPVSLVSLATLEALSAELGRAVDPQRFRSNLVLALDGAEPFAEDRLTGSRLRFGELNDAANSAELQILERIPRCRFVALDPKTTEPDPDLLRHLARCHGGRLGIYARVSRPGLLRVGDPVFMGE